MDRPTIVRLFEALKAKFSMSFNLKKEQCDLLECVLNKNDCMGILGTGFGKSLTYILPPLILDQVSPNESHISLVISPLRSLMKNQVDILTKQGIPAVAILQRSEMKDEEIEGIKDGKYSIVYGSPEAVNSDFWSAIIRKREFRKMVSVVAIDEAHCVIQWGKSFREDYLKVTWLRPVLQHSPFLFLTATCTPAMKDDILKQFSVQTVQVIASVPDRKNIFLQYKCYPGMRIDECLTFYIDELREKGINARKCIIYTRVNPAGEIFEEFVSRLKGKIFTAKGERLIDVFVAKTSEVAKEEILKIFPTQTSHIRCLIASSAFGMGVDIPDIELVVHWGASASVLDYWQEVGRCGRDGRSCEAITLATPISVSDKRMTDDCIRRLHKEVTRDKSCLRLGVLRVLYLDCMGTEEMERVAKKDKCNLNCEENCLCCWCTCCSVCRMQCRCQQ